MLTLLLAQAKNVTKVFEKMIIKLEKINKKLYDISVNNSKQITELQANNRVIANNLDKNFKIIQNIKNIIA